MNRLMKRLGALHGYQQVALCHTMFYLVIIGFTIWGGDQYSASRLVNFLGLSSDIQFWIIRPWTLITHLFIHIYFAHFFLNLLFLYVIGKELESIIGYKKWWRTYLLGTFGGAVFYILSAVVFNSADRYLIGNSAANMALVFGLVAIDYNRKINFWGILILEMKWVAVIFLVLDLIGIRQGWNAGGHWAHFGGALVGWFFLKQKSGKHSADFFTLKRPKSDEQFNQERAAKERRLNEILDKISRSGYESLNAREKDFLKQQSNS